ncbi:protein-L-isoaspartate(D-aspartate) O-methyltransferase [Thiohalorhabdus methylotrophus]|uniref:Protein-L-isoaspartate O-methyltransferase n=1 Tax=Thiohalorhabdus methylotrophus TaxID=3242694 RepID=A0ABV4TYF7_9GAMM
MAPRRPHDSGTGMTSARTRERMVDGLRARGIGSEAALSAMQRVPRHLFVDEALATRAYEDTALPIGWGQTLSQPWEVARMTEAVLEVAPERVLEVGAGSGYQSAVLAELVDGVWAVELLPQLARRGKQNLRTLGYGNVRFRDGDGRTAWRESAPFDAGLMAASAEGPPEEILDQIRVGGCLVGPVGTGEDQRLIRWLRNPDGFQAEDLGPCCFVPLRHQAGTPSSSK